MGFLPIEDSRDQIDAKAAGKGGDCQVPNWNKMTCARAQVGSCIYPLSAELSLAMHARVSTIAPPDIHRHRSGRFPSPDGCVRGHHYAAYVDFLHNNV
jgi:hypothetical protein